MGPKTITIGTALFWSWGFWDSRPESLILMPKIGMSFFEIRVLSWKVPSWRFPSLRVPSWRVHS